MAKPKRGNSPQARQTSRQCNNPPGTGGPFRYQILFAPSAAQQLRLLTTVVQRRVVTAIARLAESPDLGKPLKGELNPYRSYRVGDYRMIYSVDHRTILVEHIRIAHRREVYR